MTEERSAKGTPALTAHMSKTQRQTERRKEMAKLWAPDTRSDARRRGERRSGRKDETKRVTSRSGSVAFDLMMQQEDWMQEAGRSAARLQSERVSELDKELMHEIAAFAK